MHWHEVASNYTFLAYLTLSSGTFFLTFSCAIFVVVCSHRMDAENRTLQHRVAYVTILPEIVLPHPIYGGDSNSLSKFRSNETMRSKLLKFQSKSHPWPAFVYQQYDTSFAVDKIIQFLDKLKIGEYDECGRQSEKPSKFIFLKKILELSLFTQFSPFFLYPESIQEPWKWIWWRCHFGSVKMPF